MVGVCVCSQAHTIRSVQWSADETRVLFASHDGTVRVRDAATGRCMQVLEGHRDCVVAAAWARDPNYALSCDASGGLRL